MKQKTNFGKEKFNKLQKKDMFDQNIIS